MSEEHLLKRNMGGFGLLFISIGAMIGSGWLFSALYAAQLAGPAAIISWIIAACIGGVIALVFAELGAMLPVAGGLARYPHLAFGGVTSYLTGWLCWLGYVVVAPVETMAILEYLGNLLPWLTVVNGDDRTLSPAGTGVAVFILAALTIINMVGVRMLSESNNWLTIWKIIVPTGTAILFLCMGFNSENFTVHGFAPNGINGIFSAVAAGGVMFSLIGFRAAIELSGEAKNPQKDVPRAIIGSLLICTVIYIMLQVAFIGVVPESSIEDGWGGLVSNGASGPFAAFAVMLGMSWLATVLYVDATLSPFGTSLVFTAATSRLTVAMSRNKNVPKIVGRINKRGVPFWSLLINFLVGLILLAPLPGWNQLVAIISASTVLAGGIGAISMMVLRRNHPEMHRPLKLPFGNAFALMAFTFGNLIAYWCGWDVSKVIIIVILVSLILLLVFSRGLRPHYHEMHPTRSIWIFPYLAGLFILSWLGPYKGGIGILASPWGDLAVVAWSLIMGPIGCRCGVALHHGQKLMESVHEEIGLPPTQAASD